MKIDTYGNQYTIKEIYKYYKESGMNNNGISNYWNRLENYNDK